MNRNEIITQATGLEGRDAELVEDIMRNEVFHGTLDWQSRAMLEQGAREAAEILAAMKHDPRFASYVS